MAYLFQDEEVPAGFRFPDAFIHMMSLAEIPHYEPWWFLLEFPDTAREWLHMLRESFPGRTLIPFAKYDIYPEVACFDGTDLSGNPAVLYVNADAPPGQELGGQVANFAEWLEVAKEEAAEWLAQRSGDPVREAPIRDGDDETRIPSPVVPKA